MESNPTQLPSTLLGSCEHEAENRTQSVSSLWHNSASAAPHAQPPQGQRAQSCPPAHIAPSAHLGWTLRRAADYLLRNSLLRLGQRHSYQLPANKRSSGEHTLVVLERGGVHLLGVPACRIINNPCHDQRV